jgi:CheY-like chemotaxis protein
LIILTNYTRDKLIQIFGHSMQQIDIIRIYEKKRCLVVDDLTEVRASYKRMLKSFGAIDVDTAANGDEAIQKCETNQYELILCDYNLADSKDGQQVLEELRHRELLKYTTLFIIITAEMSREMVLGAIENQPDDYITKPISQQTMRLRVDRAVLKHENLLAIKMAIDEKDYGKAIEKCNEKIRTNNHYRIECLQYKAQLLLLMGKYTEAKKIYEKVLSERELVWAQIGLAKVLIKNEEYERVEPLLMMIVDNDHRYIEAYDLLSEYYEKTKDYRKSQEYTQLATQLSPKSIIRHRRLAEIAEKNNDEATSLEAYENTIRWNYNSCYAQAEDYLALARNTVSLTRESSNEIIKEPIKKALAMLERMARRFPSNKNQVKLALIEAQLLSNQGKKDQAQTKLNIANKEYEQLNLKDIDVRFDYAQSHIMLGNKQKAYQELHIIYKEKKNDKKILDKIDRISDEPITTAGKQCAADLTQQAIAAYAIKNYTLALKIFTDAHSMFPQHTGVSLNMLQVILAKAENEGKNKTLYYSGKTCVQKLGIIHTNNKHYKRYHRLLAQYNDMFSEFEV